MSDDPEMTQLLIRLAEAIREVPEGPEHTRLTRQFFALIQYLERKGLVRGARWDLSSTGKQ